MKTSKCLNLCTSARRQTEGITRFLEAVFTMDAGVWTKTYPLTRNPRRQNRRDLTTRMLHLCATVICLRESPLQSKYIHLHLKWLVALCTSVTILDWAVSEPSTPKWDNRFKQASPVKKRTNSHNSNSIPCLPRFITTMGWAAHSNNAQWSLICRLRLRNLNSPQTVKWLNRMKRLPSSLTEVKSTNNVTRTKESHL